MGTSNGEKQIIVSCLRRLVLHLFPFETLSGILVSNYVKFFRNVAGHRYSSALLWNFGGENGMGSRFLRSGRIRIHLVRFVALLRL
jgi:hypothetical protein